MKQNPLISIVVPIYNVEKYLNRCIESLINQKYENIEIILIDDGSPDNCPKMCDEWKKKDNRIKVIHKSNEGLGMARNTGIENAKGDYIFFVDSDDVIDLDTLEKCCKKIQKKDYDVIYFGYKYIDIEDNIKRKFIPTPPKSEYFNEEVKNVFLPNLINTLPYEYNFNLNMSSCMCLIKIDLINKINWRFVSERKIISEDVYSLTLLFKNINSICIIPECFYSYRVNSSSLTHSYRRDRFDKVKEMHLELLRLFDESYIKERFDYMFLSYTIGCIKGIVNSNLNYNDKKKEIKRIMKDKKLNRIIDIYIKRETFIRKIYFTLVKLKMVNILYMLTIIQIKRSVR